VNNYSIAERINSDVNASVTWMSDSQQFGVPEFWCEARSGFDDCDVTIFCALNHVTNNISQISALSDLAIFTSFFDNKKPSKEGGVFAY